MRSIIERSGYKYIPVDAGGSAASQLPDVERMIAQGIDALVIQLVDKDEIMSAVERVAQAGIPMIAYDRLIEHEKVFDITFDNVGVGRIIHRQTEATGRQLCDHQGRSGRRQHGFPAGGHGRGDRPCRGRRTDQDRRRDECRWLETR
jgi:ABC-type xylose transport system substrate-binding protein